MNETQKFLDWCAIMFAVAIQENINNTFGPSNVSEFEKRFAQAWREQFGTTIKVPKLLVR